MDEEEVSFARTLDRGERLFEQYAVRAKDEGSLQLNGKDVWRLYDTFGFPVDLTRLMAEEMGLGINDAELEEAQALSKEASKSSTKQGDEAIVKLDVHDIALLEANIEVPKTDDLPKFSEYQKPNILVNFNEFKIGNPWMRPLKPFFTTRRSLIPLLSYPKPRRSVLSWIERASTQNREAKNATLGTLW